MFEENGNSEAPDAKTSGKMIGSRATAHVACVPVHYTPLWGVVDWDTGYCTWEYQHRCDGQAGQTSTHTLPKPDFVTN